MRHVSIGVLSLCVLAFAGCGGDTTPAVENPAAPDTGSPGAPPKAEPSADTPQEIGTAVGAIYVDTMKAITEALASRPDVEAAKSTLTPIKAAAIEKLVALGHKRAALDAAGQAIVNQKTSMALGRVPSDVFKAFSEAHKHYMKADRETGDLVASFNTITQYAAFELLEKQLPKEYERLGLGE